MNKFCVATHGHLADGYKSALSILTGAQDAVTFVNAYIDDSDYREGIKDFLDGVGDGDTGVIFTDILGGSVFQQVMLMEPEKRNIFHITGINLALVIEILLSGQELTKSYLEMCVEGARAAVQLVEAPTGANAEEDEGNFFA